MSSFKGQLATPFFKIYLASFNLPSSSSTLAADIQISAFLGFDWTADFSSNLALEMSPIISGLIFAVESWVKYPTRSTVDCFCSI